MDARDICRKLNCSPVLLSEWVERGCPIDRYPPYAGFETDKVKQWAQRFARCSGSASESKKLSKYADYASSFPRGSRTRRPRTPPAGR